jgi:RNA polymerase sigma-70 factor (ECF subfamily)
MVLQPTILQLVAAGDPDAMRACMDRFGGLVWSLARQMGARADAEDATQEVFLDLWRSAGRFDPSVASETTFVAMIARRRLIDRSRRRQRRLQPEALAEEPEARARSASEPGELREEAGTALRAMEQLRPEQRRVLQLAIFQGCSHEEIARATGLPLGTVKTHARRGLMRLRQALEGEGALPPDGRKHPADGGT